MLSRKSEIGIGTLIIFISLLIVAAVAAAVVIQSSISFQEKGHSTFEQTRQKASTYLNIVSVFGETEDFQAIDELVILAKLSGEPIKLSGLMLSLNLPWASVFYSYRPNASDENSLDGYFVNKEEEFGAFTNYYELVDSTVDRNSYLELNYVDLNLDSQPDHIRVCGSGATACEGDDGRSGRYLQVRVSGVPEYYYVPFLNESGDIFQINLDVDQNYHVIDYPIGDYGFVTITGSNPDGTYNIYANRIRFTTVPHEITKSDIGGDLERDYIAFNRSDVLIILSNGSIYSFDTGKDIFAGPVTFDDTIELRSPGVNFGIVEIQGTTSARNLIDEDVLFRFTPSNTNRGYYYATKEMGSDPDSNILQPSDMLKIRIEAPGDGISASERAQIRILLNNGFAETVSITVPSVINQKNTQLY
jgi:archaellin